MHLNKELVNLGKSLMCATSKDKTRVRLAGIYVGRLQNPNPIVLTATDGQVLLYAEVIPSMFGVDEPIRILEIMFGLPEGALKPHADKECFVYYPKAFEGHFGVCTDVLYPRYPQVCPTTFSNSYPPPSPPYGEKVRDNEPYLFPQLGAVVSEFIRKTGTLMGIQRNTIGFSWNTPDDAVIWQDSSEHVQRIVRLGMPMRLETAPATDCATLLM